MQRAREAGERAHLLTLLCPLFALLSARLPLVKLLLLLILLHTALNDFYLLTRIVRVHSLADCDCVSLSVCVCECVDFYSCAGSSSVVVVDSSLKLSTSLGSGLLAHLYTLH